jgi:RNA polymerase sigma factor (sigma-70 family)
MAAAGTRIFDQLRTTLLSPALGELSDGQLLQRFIRERDQGAFELLLRRHGPMVFGVCQRLLRNRHDAEDAFQATFLVLARKAASVSPRDAVANWLFGVARLTAVRVRALQAKRRARETPMPHLPEAESPPPNESADLLALLDEALARLPDKYRLAVVLCDLEGRARKEVARQLGIPEGTVSSRLATGRQMLAKRFAAKGLAISGGAVAASLTSPTLSASVPAALVASTAAAATGTTMSVVSKQIIIFTEEVMKTLFVQKLKLGAMMLGLAAVACMGLAIGYEHAAGQASGAAVAQPRLASGKEPDLDAWQGVWKATSWQRPGQPVPKDLAPLYLMVRGSRCCIQGSGVEVQGGLYLDSTARPKAFDFATYKHTWRGIYSFDGARLTICYVISDGDDGLRPRNFVAEHGGAKHLLVLEREAKDATLRRPDGSLTFPDLIGLSKQPLQPPPSQIIPPEQSVPNRDGAPSAKPSYVPVPVVAEQPKRNNEELRRVGSIYIVGNEKTPDAVIRECLPFAPGEPIHYSRLRLAEKRLSALGLFVEDPKKGIRPTVTIVEDTDAPFLDIIVNVQEVVVTPEQKGADDADKEVRESLRRLEQALSAVEDRATRASLQRQVDELRRTLDRSEGSTGARLREAASQVRLAQAERDLKVAEFYDRTKRTEAAIFSYELLCARYPGTPFAEWARQRVEELRKRSTK